MVRTIAALLLHRNSAELAETFYDSRIVDCVVQMVYCPRNRAVVWLATALIVKITRLYQSASFFRAVNDVSSVQSLMLPISLAFAFGVSERFDLVWWADWWRAFHRRATGSRIFVLRWLSRKCARYVFFSRRFDMCLVWIVSYIHRRKRNKEDFILSSVCRRTHEM